MKNRKGNFNKNWVSNSPQLLHLKGYRVKRWVCLFFSIAVFLTDLHASNGKIGPEVEFPVKEIEKENLKAGLLIAESLSDTSESGRQSLIQIRLQKRPIANITVFCRSLNEQEGKIIGDALQFTVENWNKPQSCKVEGQNDETVDGDQNYTIVIEVSSKKDMEYSRLPPRSIELVNRDNDRAGIIVNQNGKNTSEQGQSATFSLQLSSRPSADVVVPFRSSNEKEGRVSPKSILFTPSNWDTPRFVTVTGQNDFIADGSQSYSVEPGPLVSSDPLFQDLKPEPVVFVNLDDDQAGFLISSPVNRTGENGLETSIRTRLQSRPVNQVVLRFASSNRSEGDVNPGQLTFNRRNWDQPQTVRVFGIDDSMDDGDQSFHIQVSARKSKDKNYATLSDQVLAFINKDNDQAGFIIDKKQTVTTETGGLAKISLKLTSKPTSALKLTFRSSDPGEGRLLIHSFRFTHDDWFQEKTLTVAGVDDSLVDGDQPYHIIIDRPITEDALYAAIDPDDVKLINKDDEKTGLTVDQSGSETSENGAAVRLAIRLNARPSADVAVNLSSSDLSEATVSPQRLTFTPNQWNQLQSVTVTGQPDGLVDGHQDYQINVAVDSPDPQFSIQVPGIPLTNKDINTFDILYRLQGEEVSEQGSTRTLALKLNSNPEDDLTVAIESRDPGEGIAIPNSLIFTRSNWQRYQTVTIKGVDDDIKDGLQTFQVAVSAKDAGKGYHDRPPLLITMKNRDDDREGITVKQLSENVSEAEGRARFSVKLNSEPASSVIFIFSTTDPTEGQMLDNHAAFYPDNWNREQIIRVGGVRDYIVDGARKFQVVSLGGISKDPNYNKMAFPALDMVCHDSDQAGFTVGNLEGRASEDGGKATFNLKLTTRPSAAVVIGLDSDDHTEGTVSPSRLTFDANNWNQGHKVMIAGLKDNEKDGDTDFHVLFTQAESDDVNYNGLSPASVRVTNHDNMKMAIGLTVTRFEFRDDMKEKLDESFAVGVYGAYVYRRNIDLEVALYNFTGKGDNVVRKYNVDNPMSYRLGYTSLVAGARYAFWRDFLTTYLKGGFELAYWRLESLNNLSGNKESNAGSSMGTYAGFGVDYTAFGRFILALEWSYHIVSRGLGNNRSTFTIKYPF